MSYIQSANKLIESKVILIANKELKKSLRVVRGDRKGTQ
jgi:hypothetical protein